MLGLVLGATIVLLALEFAGEIVASYILQTLVVENYGVYLVDVSSSESNQGAADKEDTAGAFVPSFVASAGPGYYLPAALSGAVLLVL